MHSFCILRANSDFLSVYGQEMAIGTKLDDLELICEKLKKSGRELAPLHWGAEAAALDIGILLVFGLF